MRTQHCSEEKPHKSHVWKQRFPNYAANTVKTDTYHCPGHEK